MEKAGHEGIQEAGPTGEQVWEQLGDSADGGASLEGNQEATKLEGCPRGMAQRGSRSGENPGGRADT